MADVVETAHDTDDEELESEENEEVENSRKQSSRKSSRKTSAPVESQRATLTKTDLNSKKNSLGKADVPKSGTPKKDSLKPNSPKPDYEKSDLKAESVETEKPNQNSQRRQTLKEEPSISPNQDVKPDSSIHESEEFDDEKLIEFPGEAVIDRLPFHKETGFFYFVEKGEYFSVWGEDESSVVSTASATALVSEVEETEEEREIRKEREALIDKLRQKLLERTLLRRRNTFLNKKLAEHFKKRRMENVLREEPKGLDLENKYLRSLYAFKKFKEAQEEEIKQLTCTMEKYENQIKQLEADLEENLKTSAARAKEVSLNLILTKTGKKINEKMVDRLLRRQIQKSEEKGKEKLKYIKIKNLIEEKEHQLKAMEYFGEGLHIAAYEQMKIDNQNYSDKIEEKEDELTKLRLKTQTMIQNLAHVREKIYAVEGDIELMEEKVYEVEKTFVETRERLTAARIKRDNLRILFRRYKNASGLLTRTDLLRDFEESISRAKNLSAYLQRLKRSVLEKNRQENKLAKIISSANAALSETNLPLKVKLHSKSSGHLKTYTQDKAIKHSDSLWVRRH